MAKRSSSTTASTPSGQEACSATALRTTSSAVPRHPGIYECRWQTPNDAHELDRALPEFIERSFYNLWDGTCWHYGLSSLRALKNVVARSATIPIEKRDGWLLLAWKGKK